MPRSLLIALAAVGLDAVGIGLVFPLLPRLVAVLGSGVDAALLLGLLTALYAAMQFVFAPLLGAASDRIGRRPVLLVSLAGASLNYLVMALAPQLWLLFAGRAIAGLTSANMAVATAIIADVTPEDERTRRFGQFNAVFGAGFIVGPVLGGLLGEHGLRLPFLAAALLSGGNLLLAVLMLPETRPAGRPPRGRAAPGRGVPARLPPLRFIASIEGLRPILLTIFVLAATGEVYGTCWALWGSDAFHWDGLRVGLSLGAFGICQTLAQALLPGPAAARLGERGAILTGLAGAGLALLVMAFARQGWMIFAILPIFALGGIGVPALQALASRKVDAERQGQFQGVVASVVSLASIVAPLAFSALYFLVRPAWPGAIWLVVIVLYALAAAVVLRLGFAGPERSARA
ncbi:MFS transporter [Prosthecomicrobium pneumaticum]|uniref:DHA1 family tetracycline resistance protein-like MFS transporter n=1 Tax=Prosthecomicrobium pneumaticum TaxID=81895 RepID=A0A7W9L3X0_9HYPH|nr:MFS transporter [Prosthecomicrobium pneumaticum]MBB5754985.1 DHA1 family tetracycline resistance protein-like MFS transporter [Prosthecomicrobium pneumaticum]